MNIYVKKTFFTGLLLFCISNSFAQKSNIDSIKNLLTLQNDEMELTIKSSDIADAYYLEKNTDSALFYSRKSYQYAVHSNNKEYCCKNLSLIGDIFIDKKNYPESISYYLSAYKIAEERNDYKSLVQIFISLSFSYMDVRDLNKSIEYLQKAYELNVKEGDEYQQSRNLCQIGYLYTELNKLDSAQTYYDLSKTIASRNQNDRIPYILTGYGIIYDGYFSQALDSCIKYNEINLGYQILSQIGKLFLKEKKIDSSIIYYNIAADIFDSLNLHYTDWPRRDLDFYKDLAIFYAGIDSNAGFNKDYNSDVREYYQKKALKYFTLVQNLNDSLFNETTSRSITELTLKEEEEREKRAFERNRNIQNIVTGMGILLFIMLFFLLSRTVLVNIKIIIFLGALMLLLVFEFFNLLLHPWLEQLTHHSQPLLLLALAVIGSILVRLHHILERWVVQMVTKKNSQIKLTAARK